MQESSTLVQAIRSVNRNNRNTTNNTTTDPAEIVYVDIHTEPGTQKQFVFWEDIQLAFEGAVHARHQARVVPFLRGPDLRPRLEPQRSLTLESAISDVVVDRQLLRVETPSSQLTLSVTSQELLQEEPPKPLEDTNKPTKA
ncbi:hypothetical protein BGX29_007024 [Mortierella sp. GBA35]|nr:hypothetical protein BGX29_007024 [Mortierella sp. GBA35]